MVRDAKFQISLADHVDDGWRDLTNGVNFRLDEDRIPQVWGGYLPALLRDLARVGTAVYVSDRLTRRPRRQARRPLLASASAVVCGRDSSWSASFPELPTRLRNP